MVNPLFYGRIKLMETTLKSRVYIRHVGHDESHAGTQDAVVSAVEEEGNPDAIVGESIGMGAVNANDQTMQAQSSQLIGHAARSHLLG